MQTDGLSDNVFTPDIVAICSLVARSGGSENVQAQMMANRIIEYAQVCMRERKKMTPFSRKSCFCFCLHTSHLSRTCVVRRRSLAGGTLLPRRGAFDLDLFFETSLMF